MSARILTILAALFLAACQSAAPEAPPPPPNSNRVVFEQSTVAAPEKAELEAIPEFERYLPRVPGQKRAWILEYRQGEQLLLRGRREQEVVGKRLIDGQDYFVSRWSLSLEDPRQKPRSGELIERLSDEGLFERVGDQDRRRLAFPLAVGASWFEAREKWAISYVVEGLQAFDAGGETYERCIKVRGLLTHKDAAKNQVIESYYARDIGLVYRVVYEQGDRRRVLTLIPERS